MAKVLFASNNINHFPGSAVGSVAGSFDSSKVPYAVNLTNFQSVSSPVFLPSSVDTTWFHFRSRCDFSPYNGTGSIFQCFDAQNKLIAKVSKKDSDWAQSLTLTVYNGTTGITVQSVINMVQSQINTLDIKIEVSNIIIRAELYINGTLAAQAQFGANPAGITNPIKFFIGCSHTGNINDSQSFSELLVAESDTRNARLSLLRPNAEGANSQWTGSISSLADDDSTSGILTTQSGLRHSAKLTAYSGPANISNLIVASQTTKGAGGPSKIRHTIREGGVNYDSADIPLSDGLQYNIFDTSLNPATGLPWTSSDLSLLEVGVLSVT